MPRGSNGMGTWGDKTKKIIKIAVITASSGKLPRERSRQRWLSKVVKDIREIDEYKRFEDSEDREGQRS